MDVNGCGWMAVNVDGYEGMQLWVVAVHCERVWEDVSGCSPV